MTRPDHTKTDTEKAREEELIQRYLNILLHTYIYLPMETLKLKKINNHVCCILF